MSRFVSDPIPSGRPWIESMFPLHHLQWFIPLARVSLDRSSARLASLDPHFRHYSSLPVKSFPTVASRPTSQLQIYQSLSRDPFVNLSLENFLLKHSPVDSKILFLYINRPCVVIGRNQNPWLETNIGPLSHQTRSEVTGGAGTNNDEGVLRHVQLVRRRSGGGAVFHDEGNLNFGVICPKPIFHRDTHAEMVVRALKRIGAVNAKVNERHDIVLGQRQPADEEPLSTMVVSVGTEDPESPRVERTPRALKISGSAYKLSRFRALHHGTCLIDSPNLNQISGFLRSPARPYLKARGVESVRSPVGNVSSAVPGLQTTELIQRLSQQIMKEFAELYGLESTALLSAEIQPGADSGLALGGNWVVGTLTESIATDEIEIQKGVQELQSLDWTYNQCPQFTFSTHPTYEDPRPRPDIPPDILSADSRAFLRVKSGAIIESQISTSPDATVAHEQASRLHECLSGRRLHEISDWKAVFDAASDFAPEEQVAKFAHWLNSKLGR